jgi:hypothetical protein
MSIDALNAWLKRKIVKRILGCWLGAGLALVVGAVVLFLTFWLN